MGPAQMTLAVSVTVMLMGLPSGSRLGDLIYGPLGARLLVRAYVDLVRGLPILILIFLVFYGLPAAASICRISSRDASRLGYGSGPRLRDPARWYLGRATGRPRPQQLWGSGSAIGCGTSSSRSPFGRWFRLS
jgi:His/Glu/Gln/Arg/opine family amino acid ABC transporter permease subunit